MGDYCLRFQSAEYRRQVQEQRQREREARRQPITAIAGPIPNEHLRVQTSGGVKALVCKARRIIACLAPGDVVRITWRHKLNSKWRNLGLTQPSAKAVFQAGDRFALENGRTIDVQSMNRKMTVQVISVAPRDHKHEAVPEYNESAIRNMLNAVPLPEQVDSRCGTLVHA